MKADVTPQIVTPELLQGQLPRELARGWTLLLVWAPSSASSRQIRQELELAVHLPGLKLLSLQVEDAMPIVTALAIPSVPYLVLLHAGTEVARHPGNAPLPDLLDWMRTQRSD